MPDGIGDGLLTDTVEGIADAQWKGPVVAFGFGDNLNRTAFDHAPRTDIRAL